MLTLSMIVKNEEKYLRECLESVKSVVDEIIIVDTGSTDKTIEIAAEYGANIFHFAWINDFAAARNYALDHSSGDWILYLDADERLSKKSINELKQLTAVRNDKAYYCKVNNIDEINNRPAIMDYVRLFPNSKQIRFVGAVHEQIENSLITNNYKIEKSGVEIIHVGYSIERDELQKKAKRNLEILLNEFNTNPSSYYAYQIGQTYGILEDKENALRYFEVSLTDPALKREYRSIANRYIAVHYADMYNWDAALNYINNSLKEDPEQPQALLVASKIYLHLNNFKEAAALCHNGLEINRKYIRGEKSSYQILLLDEKIIIYHGLNIAIAAKDNELFNYYYNLLRQNSSSTGEEYSELELIDILLNNKEIHPNNISRYALSIDNNNIDIILPIISNYKHLDIKLKLMEAAYDKFSKNYLFLNTLGLLYTESRNFAEAVKNLEQSRRINSKEPSTVFYLVSVYLQSNLIDKIPGLITSAENENKDRAEVINQLNILKSRLTNIL